MEKRQAVVLLVLVLAVSLASFALGVIVGRRGAERDLAQKVSHAEKVLVAQVPVATPPETVSPRPKVAPDVTEQADKDEPKLSFYDDLGKETVPLGSGINLPPAEEKAAEPVQPPIDLPAQPIVKKKIAAVEKPIEKEIEPKAVVAEQSLTGMPKVAAGGSHAVQIGSFGTASDAVALKKKMLGKGYPAFVVEADLGKKGLWYRVRIGPYTDATAAKAAQKQLEKKEKIKGFISRQ
jgi:cell division septation protein DedD